MSTWHPSGADMSVELGRGPVLMGVLNVTPDSFSDGGRWANADAAVRHGLRLATEGADIVDVGGESTRPGSARVTEAEEMSRVLPVVGPLSASGIYVSVDTVRASVAAAAIRAGARMVNDVSGGTADPAMRELVARTGVAYVVMHSRGPSATMADRTRYGDVKAETVRELGERVMAALDRGIDGSQLVVDPGIGFAKTARQSWSILANIEAVLGLGYPVLVGASRKSFLVESTPLAMDAAGRDQATAATTALLVTAGVWGVRVHNVALNREAAAVGRAWRHHRASAPIDARPGLASGRRRSIVGQ